MRAFACLIAGVVATSLHCGGADHTRPESASDPDPVHRIRFVDGTDDSGVEFLHRAGRSPRRLMPEIMGSGVAIADFDRNGAPDIVLVDSGRLDGDGAPSPRIFLNDGSGRFVDRTDAWGLVGRAYGMGAAVGDYDNDGWTDLFLTGFGRAELLLRNTGSSFEDVTRSAGIVADDGWSASAGFLDVDLDGDLDLYVTRYVDYDLATALECYTKSIHVYCTPVLYEALGDRLWRNEGDGTFTDVSASAGLPAEAGKGLALGIGDVDLDGDPDLYVANDTSPNRLLINDGRGALEDHALPAGVAYDEFGKENAGMGVDFSDFDDDGHLDIVCTNFQNETTNLYRHGGDALFYIDVSDAAGVGQTARARLSFGVDFFDADNDGDEDLLVANGHISDNIRTYTEGVTFEQPNTLYENLGAGRFEEITDRAGPALADHAVSRGLATADLDSDGDLDFVVNNNEGPARIGRNETASPGSSLVLWLEGRRANRSAIGARVVARVGERTIVRQVHGSVSYLSVSDFRIHVGLGEAEAVDELTIYWPGSAPQTIGRLAAGRFYHIVEGAEPVPFVPGELQAAP